MIEQSDVITFHNYENAQEFEKRIKWLQQYDRPIICTEYMSRGNGSFFEGSLPVAKKYNVGAINWGLVDGKSQTIYPWDSWKKLIPKSLICGFTIFSEKTERLTSRPRLI
jgi:hypothetical protein